MAMRSQIYAWDLYGEGTAPSGPVEPFPTPSIINPGTGYTAFTSYSTQAVTGSGSGLGITVVSVGGGGEVTGVGVTTFTFGNGYKVGDVVRLIGGGSASNCTIQINQLQIQSNDWTGPSVLELGVPTSIFIGGKGNNIKNKATTKEMQFIVVENFGCTPTVFFPGQDNGATWDVAGGYRGVKIRNALGGPRAYIQFIINTTGYFKDSDGVPRNGLPGNVAPYPLTTQFSVCLDRKQPPVYILPTQTWDMQITCFNDYLADGNRTQLHGTTTGQLQAFFKYTLYDGVDSIIALRLLESAISITPENVDMFKRNLYENNITMPSNEEQANEE
tara:strand:- start:14835 stop:15824 length:990 start_codon:yes stop_codon:yes gene_type:complete